MRVRRLCHWSVSCASSLCSTVESHVGHTCLIVEPEERGRTSPSGRISPSLRNALICYGFMPSTLESSVVSHRSKTPCRVIWMLPSLPLYPYNRATSKPKQRKEVFLRGHNLIGYYYNSFLGLSQKIIPQCMAKALTLNLQLLFPKTTILLFRTCGRS